MNASTVTEFPRRGHLYSGPRQFSEGWPLLRQPQSAQDAYPWICPSVNSALERWSDAQVVEPTVQGTTPVTQQFLDACYSRGLDVAVERDLGLHDIDVWRVFCPDHRFEHSQVGRYLDVWVSLPVGIIDAVELVDPTQTDDALARVRLDDADVTTWLDVIRQEVPAV